MAGPLATARLRYTTLHCIAANNLDRKRAKQKGGEQEKNKRGKKNRNLLSLPSTEQSTSNTHFIPMSGSLRLETPLPSPGLTSNTYCRLHVPATMSRAHARHTDGPESTGRAGMEWDWMGRRDERPKARQLLSI